MKNISSALIRSYGFMGFMVFGLGAIFFGNRIFGIGIDLRNPSFYGFDAMLLIPWFLFFAFIGMFIGWGIGASVKIQNHVEDIRINPILLYGANGSFMWMFSFIILSFAIGKEGTNEIMLSIGSIRFFLFIIGIGLLGSLLISLMLFLVQFIRSNSQS